MDHRVCTSSREHHLHETMGHRRRLSAHVLLSDGWGEASEPRSVFSLSRYWCCLSPEQVLVGFHRVASLLRSQHGVSILYLSRLQRRRGPTALARGDRLPSAVGGNGCQYETGRSVCSLLLVDTGCTGTGSPTPPSTATYIYQCPRGSIEYRHTHIL